MFYYYVWVRSNRYHGNEPLTYMSDDRLQQGSIVQVELQKSLVTGVVTGLTSKPRFNTKPIKMAYDLPPIPNHLLKVSQWLQHYYPAPIGILTQQLLPVALPDHIEYEEHNDHVTPRLAQLPPLTIAQKQALEALAMPGNYLLHGTTGSGKTRIYIEKAAEAIEHNKSVIILTPEISLTSQLGQNFQSIFGKRVVVVHSQQAPSVRRKAWLSCLCDKTPVIIIGPRSALFSPVQNIGLIVLDEAHESAYKQEQAPQYQTSRVAAYLSNLTHATLILGTATPSITDYFIAEQKHRPIVTLNTLAKSNHQPSNDIVIVDRKNNDLFVRSPYLSTPLIEAIESALSSNLQSLLYLNRRGTARLILCENCAWQALCPHCDLALTYHSDRHELRCHSCNYHTNPMSNCPVCNHSSIIFKTAGTKAIVEEVIRLFPQAKVARFDTDNLKSERFEQQYDDIKLGKINILVGTQLLAKGLDLPLLSTLGILLADTSLYMPDFTAQERTYQLISQVLGRIGRGHTAGKAIIQTYHPDHPILEDAITGNYQNFYKKELESRKQYFFPPYCYLLKISVRRSSSQAAESAAQKFKAEIELSGYKVRVEGPAPCFHERFQKKYQWQLVIKAVDRSELLRIIAQLPANWAYDIDPNDLM